MMKLNNCGVASSKSELQKYLGEETEEHSNKFDILGWWKINSTRFLVLSHLACDVLAIPIRTVASESALALVG
jgi:hypothetical protein